jgi:hypothetical protein
MIPTIKLSVDKITAEITLLQTGSDQLSLINCFVLINSFTV